MFLKELNESEKKAFLSLSVHAANANDVFDEEEREMLEEYCKEMNVSFFDADYTQSMDEIQEVFSKSPKRIQKIVLLETLGLLYADGEYDKKEKGFVLDCFSKMGIEKDDIEMMTFHIKRYLDLVNDISIELSNEK